MTWRAQRVRGLSHRRHPLVVRAERSVILTPPRQVINSHEPCAGCVSERADRAIPPVAGFHATLKEHFHGPVEIGRQARRHDPGRRWAVWKVERKLRIKRRERLSAKAQCREAIIRRLSSAWSAGVASQRVHNDGRALDGGAYRSFHLAHDRGLHHTHLSGSSSLSPEPEEGVNEASGVVEKVGVCRRSRAQKASTKQSWQLLLE
eukprot:scaffold133110_cov63-Phaeocystis_antarctica.AAC.1